MSATGQAPTSIHLLAIRTPDGLRSLRLASSRPAALPRTNGEGLETWNESLRLEWSDLPPTNRLQSAWSAIRGASGATDTTLADLLTVLIESDFVEGRPARQTPILAAPASPPRATAAHPRSFKGTTHRPPKPGRPPRLDLTHALTNRGSTWTLLDQLLPHTESAITLLRARGFEPARLAEVRHGLKEGKRFDPGLAYFAGIEVASRARADKTRWLLRTARFDRPASAVPLASLLDRLFRQEHPETAELAASISASLLAATADSVLPWLEMLVAAAPARLTLALRIAAWYEPFDRVPLEQCAAFLEEHRSATDGVFACRWLFFLTETLRGLPCDHLRSGCRIATRVDSGYEFRQGPLPVRGSRGIGAQLEAQPIESWDVEPWLVLAAWRNSIALPKCEAIFDAIPWTALEPAARNEALELFCDALANDETALPVWTALVERRERFSRLLANSPGSHRAKVLKVVRGWFWSSGEKEARLVDEVLALAERLARPGLSTTNFVSYALERFVREPVLLHRVLSFDDATLLAFEKACKHQQSAGLVGDACLDVVPALGALAV